METGTKLLYRLWSLSWEDVEAYWINDGPKAVVIVLYTLCNVVVMLERFIWHYFVETDAYQVLGWGLLTARCSAAAIKLNCAAILVPVLRNFLSYIRGTVAGTYLPIDKAIIFHRYIGWVQQQPAKT
jgi:NADPH oxidase